jgi:dTDP-D-glucose 4,6-dehydratase
MNKIVVIGSSNTDMVVRSERLPRPGESVIGGGFMAQAIISGVIKSKTLSKKQIAVSDDNDNILQKFNKDESLITFVKDRKIHDYKYTMDSSKIKNELGFEAKYTFIEGINELINKEKAL